MAISSSPAMEAFLSTPELLESLFLECEIRELLACLQRVCRQWHEIINTTPSVQVHMFLRPARRVYRPSPYWPSAGFQGLEKTRSSSITSRESLASVSSLSTSPAQSTFDDSILSRSPASSISSFSPPPPLPEYTITPTPNPLLADLFAPFFTPYHDALSQPYCSRHDIENLPLARHPDCFLHEDASWRRMLLQQPPQESLGISMPEAGYSILYSRHESRKKKPKSSNTASETSSPAHDGIIRMRDLYDTVLRGLADPSLRWKVLWRPNYTLHPPSSHEENEIYLPSPLPPSSSIPILPPNSEETSNDQHNTLHHPWPTAPPFLLSHAHPTDDTGTSPNPASARSIFNLSPTLPSPNPPHGDNNDRADPFREDLIGGCTSLLMHEGAEIIVVRRREENEPFLGWSRYDEFQGRHVHPAWLRDRSGLERSGDGVVVAGRPTAGRRREL